MADPVKAARDFTGKYDVTLVLKGTTTIVAGREKGVTLIAAGSPGMAKGGSGDVLTGIISSLAAQGKDAYDAAVLGVLINGMAGEMAAKEKGEYSMTAGDTISMIGRAMESLTGTKALSDRPAIKKPAVDTEGADRFGGREADGEGAGYVFPEGGPEDTDDGGEDVFDETETAAQKKERVHGPALFLPEEDTLSFAHPKKAAPQTPPMRRRIEPKDS